MSSLAKYLKAIGKTVAGSDMAWGEYVEELKELGIIVSSNEHKEIIANYDIVVYTDAIREDDIQLTEARRLGKCVLSRGQFLYEVSKNFDKVIAVSGCHGKTTCTAMVTHIFSAAGKGFFAHIGGKDKKFSNSYFCGGEFLITEACEYKKNFLLLQPDVAVILNSRPDHMECYGSEENLKKCYLQFADSSDINISLYGDLPAYGLTFGFDKNADYHAKCISDKNGRYSFSAYEGAHELGTVELQVYGKHNILNALAAIAVARSMQIPFRYIKKGLEDFKGVERRFEFIGKINGAECIADYAHHPDEIHATVRAARRLAYKKLFIVFQPHTYSRTKNLMKQFIRVLAPMNNLLIYRTFAAREYYDDGGSALTLAQKLKKSRYGDDVRDILDFIGEAGEEDLILFLGAGDIYDISKKLIENFSGIR